MIPRLVMGYVFAFGILTLALGEGTYLYARHELNKALDARLAKRMAKLVDVHRQSGLAALTTTIARYEQYGGHSLSYRLSSPSGRIIDDIPGMPALNPGWGRHFFRDNDEDRLDPARTLTNKLSDGSMLTISADRDIVEYFDDATRAFLLSALSLLAGLAIVGGIILRQASLRRMAALNETARDILDGHLDRRVPVSPHNDEMDAIARTVNRLLDRMNELLKEMRRVSRYVAHDMRLPLVRLHDHLTRLRDNGSEKDRHGLGEAVALCDETITLFSAILRLGDIDPVLIAQTGEIFDLSELVGDLTESYELVAQDRGYQLHAHVEPDQQIFGDRDLLAQVLVNLIENGLVHTPLGSVVAVELKADGDFVRLAITDNGGGMPEDKQRRFLDDEDLVSAELPYRAALGLRLVSTIVRAHHGTFEIRQNNPGAAMCITLPKNL